MNKQNKVKVAGVWILLLIISNTCWGQISNVHTVTGQPIMLNKAYSDVQGSPYFNQDWRTGAITYNNQRMDNTQIKYNAFDDQIEIIYNNSPFLPDKRSIQAFEFTQVRAGSVVSYHFKNGFQGDGVSKENYLNLIYEGQTLKLGERISIEQISVTPATYGERPYQEFSPARLTYYLIRGEAAQQTKLSKGAFLKAFPEIQSDIKSYFKRYKVNFNDYQELSNLMAFIDGALGKNN